jgi:hypothetical protein
LSSQALSDELLALLLISSFLAAWRFARDSTLANGLLLGALLGLGGAAKLSPLLLSLPLAAYGALWLILRARQGGRASLAWSRARFGWLLTGQPAIASAVFVLANPFLWPDPVGRTLAQLEFRTGEMDAQAAAWPIAAVDNPLVALQRTGRRFNTDYSTSIRVQEWLAQTLSIDFEPMPLDMLFIAAGVVVLGALVIRSGPWSPAGLSSYLMAASSAAVIVGMGVDFYRYFLPLLVVASVALGVGIGAGWSRLQPAGGPAAPPDPRMSRRSTIPA